MRPAALLALLALVACYRGVRAGDIYEELRTGERVEVTSVGPCEQRARELRAMERELADERNAPLASAGEGGDGKGVPVIPYEYFPAQVREDYLDENATCATILDNRTWIVREVSQLQSRRYRRIN